MTRDIAIHAVDVTNVIQAFHASANNTATALPCRHCHTVTACKFISLRKATVDVIAQNPFFPGKSEPWTAD